MAELGFIGLGAMGGRMVKRRRRVLMRLLCQADLAIDKIGLNRYLDGVKIRSPGGSHARDTDALPRYPQHRWGAPADDRGHRIRRVVYAARGARPPAHDALPAGVLPGGARPRPRAG